MFKLLNCFALFCIISIYIYGHAYLNKEFTINTRQNFFIKKNCSISYLAESLSQCYLGNRLFIKIYLICYQKLGYNIIAGEYHIIKGDNLTSLLKKFFFGKVVQHKVTVTEGLTKAKIIYLLQGQYGLRNNIQETQNIQEGALFPDTYYYIYNTNSSDLLVRMQQKMSIRLSRAWKNRNVVETSILANENAALILASIIEKEAKFADEKSMTASVY